MMKSTRTSTAQEVCFCVVMREYTSNQSGAPERFCLGRLGRAILHCRPGNSSYLHRQLLGPKANERGQT